MKDTDDLKERLSKRHNGGDRFDAIDCITELEAALAAAQATIEAAPHDDDCEAGYTWPAGWPEVTCTCWKADTSTAAFGKARADALREAAELFAASEGIEATMFANDNVESVRATETWLRARADQIERGER